MAGAKTSRTGTAYLAGKEPVKVAEPDDANMELQELRLPINPANPHDTDVVVGLNGRFWQIRRGHTVKVPKAVAEILAHSEKQTAAAMEYITGAAAAEG